MRHIIFFGTILLVFAFKSEGFGQKPVRIQFVKGRNSAAVQSMTGTSGKLYIIRARGGQKIILTVTPKIGVGVKVETEGAHGHQVLLHEERGGTFEVGLEETGDYTIFLGSTNGRSAAFTVMVKIVKMTDI